MLEDYEGSRNELMKMLADQELPPAYVVRGQRVAEVWNALIERCRTANQELLEMPKLRLGQLGATIDHRWSRLDAFLVSGDAGYLEQLFQKWSPKLRIEIAPTDSLRRINQRIVELIASFERCNRRWLERVAEFSLENVNYERSQYNDYYLVEKSAALQSDRLAEMGFERLPLVSRDDLLAEVPTLRVPTPL